MSIYQLYTSFVRNMYNENGNDVIELDDLPSQSSTQNFELLEQTVADVPEVAPIGLGHNKGRKQLLAHIEKLKSEETALLDRLREDKRSKQILTSEVAAKPIVGLNRGRDQLLARMEALQKSGETGLLNKLRDEKRPLSSFATNSKMSHILKYEEAQYLEKNGYQPRVKAHESRAERARTMRKLAMKMSQTNL